MWDKKRAQWSQLSLVLEWGFSIGFVRGSRRRGQQKFWRSWKKKNHLDSMWWQRSTCGQEEARMVSGWLGCEVCVCQCWKSHSWSMRIMQRTFLQGKGWPTGTGEDLECKQYFSNFKNICKSSDGSRGGVYWNGNGIIAVWLQEDSKLYSSYKYILSIQKINYKATLLLYPGDNII